MEDKLEQALKKARNRERRTRWNVMISSIVFWSATTVIAILLYRDTPVLFTSTWGVRCLTVWTIPAAWYIMSSKWAQNAAGDWKTIKKKAAEQAYPGFCAHETKCHCRESFLQNLESQGIDLYLE